MADITLSDAVAPILLLFGGAAGGLSGAIAYIDKRTDKKVKEIRDELDALKSGMESAIGVLTTLLIEETDVEKKKKIAEAIKYLR